MSSTGTPELPLPVPQINLGPTLGACLVGVILAAVFHGITTLQAIFYYRTYPKDPIFPKLLVAVLWILDSLSLSLFSYGVYTYLVTDFGNLVKLETLVWTFRSEPVVTAVVALIVHLFLAYRIQILDNRWWPVSVVVGLTSIFACATGVSTVIISNESVSSLTEITKLKWASYSGNVSTSAIDLVIATSITYLLHRNRNGFAQTERMINKITMYAIANGLVTTVFSVGSMIAYLVAPTDFYWALFEFSISKAYTNTLIATFNSRQYIREPTPSSRGTFLHRFKAASRNVDEDGIGGKSSEVLALQPPQKGSPKTKIPGSTWA